MIFIATVLVLMCVAAFAPSAHARNHHFYPPSQPMQNNTYMPSAGLGPYSSVPDPPTAAKKATVWEAPSNDELKYKSELEASQIQNGLTHPQTMKAMWQLGQYYMNAQKFPEASQTLADLKDVATKNKSNCPLPMDQVNLAFNKAQTEMRKEQADGVGNGHANGPASGQTQGQSFRQSPHGHRPHHRRYYQP